MSERTEIVSFRLTSPTVAPNPHQLKLTRSEHKALTRAAKGQVLSTYVRWLVQAAVGWREGSREDVLDLVRARAAELEMQLGVYVRLVVLEASGVTNVREDVARAAKVAAS